MPRESVATHTMPRARSMPRYGGRPVQIFRTGTMRMQLMPRASTPTFEAVTFAGPEPTDSSARLTSPGHAADSCALEAACRLACHQRPASGTTPATREGRNRPATVSKAEILPWIQSIVVVTSPIGLQAPPAFAATTARPPQRRRHSSSSGTMWRRSLTATIVAVRLSMTELMKKLSRQMIGISASRRLRTSRSMARVTTVKPPKWSMDSTRPMAGSRKRMMLPTSSRPRLSSSWSLA
mmetsp:Transcript_11393/g.35255  ORF Transcript_11393/g.35255 Transcript_11393/m.35255 type:complete len:238 (+) Transcript_11393:860-1573(+)